MQLISLVNSFSSCKVVKDITVEELVELIKNNPNADLINQARTYGKASTQYDEIKKKLPCVSINATFNERKNNSNLNQLSGLIYVDIDNQVIDLKQFNNDPYVFASWQSLSGKGIGGIVKSDNYNKNKFKAYWIELSKYFKNSYNIELDEQTKHYSRITVISSDPNIYVNKNSIVFTANVEEEIEVNDFYEQVEAFTGPNRFLDSNKKFNYPLFKEVLKTSIPTELLNLEEECTYIEEGFDVRIFYARKNSIDTGKRNKVLSNAAYTVIYNMPDINVAELTTVLFSISSYSFKEPLKYHEILTQAKSILKNHNPNKTETRKQYYWINPYINLTKGEKIAIINKMKGSKTKENNLNSIIKSVDGLNINELTQKEVAFISGKSLRTIKSKWKEIKGAKPK